MVIKIEKGSMKIQIMIKRIGGFSVVIPLCISFFLIICILGNNLMNRKSGESVSAHNSTSTSKFRKSA